MNLRQTLPVLAFATVCCMLLSCSASTPHPDSGSAPMPSPDRIILLTRHAEKADYSSDPGLSIEGAHRAIALSELPVTQEVNEIYTTSYRRTIETALPLAQRLGILSRTVNFTGSHAALRALTDDLLDSAKAGTVLVVGHSNTVPLIIQSLGGPSDIFLTEEDFGDLFILTIDGEGRVSLERERYGD
jgi:broad specificity phosphatase PhoE